MPPSGDGYYYISSYLVVDDGESGIFDIQLNEETICTAFADQTDSTINDENTSCGAVAYVVEGASLINLLFKITFSLHSLSSLMLDILLEMISSSHDLSQY